MPWKGYLNIFSVNLVFYNDNFDERRDSTSGWREVMKPLTHVSLAGEVTAGAQQPQNPCGTEYLSHSYFFLTDLQSGSCYHVDIHLVQTQEMHKPSAWKWLGLRFLNLAQICTLQFLNVHHTFLNWIWAHRLIWCNICSCSVFFLDIKTSKNEHGEGKGSWKKPLSSWMWAFKLAVKVLACVDMLVRNAYGMCCLVCVLETPVGGAFIET